MHILPILSNTIGKNTCLNHTNRTNTNANINYFNNNIQKDTVTFGNINVTTPEKGKELLTHMTDLATKGDNYRSEVLEAINQTRINTMDILKEYGFDSDKFTSMSKESSKFNILFNKFKEDPAFLYTIEKEDDCCLSHEKITLKSKKHPDATLEIEREIGGYCNDHDEYYHFHLCYTDKDNYLELDNGNPGRYKHKAKDGIKLEGLIDLQQNEDGLETYIDLNQEINTLSHDLLDETNNVVYLFELKDGKEELKTVLDNKNGIIYVVGKQLTAISSYKFDGNNNIIPGEIISNPNSKAFLLRNLYISIIHALFYDEIT